MVYEDIFDAKNACDHLSGFNVCNRYLVVLYYNANRAFQKMDTKKKEEQLKLLKEKYGINTDPPPRGSPRGVGPRGRYAATSRRAAAVSLEA